MMASSASFRALRRLFGDRKGVALVEFALLAPVFMALFIGVVQVGIYMQNYSAIRSLASDAARDIAVEYQQVGTQPHDLPTLERDISGKAAVSPYNLDQNALTVTLTEVTPSDVDGSRKFDLDISYNPPTLISGTGFGDITIDYSRPIYVLSS